VVTDTFDCVIVGGGPAGLSAAIHLAWHDRRVLVIDRRTGPLHFTLEKLYGLRAQAESASRRQGHAMPVERG
jgi:2-polyprenyl-6-methoxyphenol hydroxylase-like FAD-dependent oxidoreductase